MLKTLRKSKLLLAEKKYKSGHSCQFELFTGNKYHGKDKMVFRIGSIVGETFAVTPEEWESIKNKIDKHLKILKKTKK